MLKTVLALLKKSKPTSAELRAELAQINPQPLEQEVERLEAERRSLLLKEGADKAIEDLEVRIRDANREIERLAAAKEELQRLLPEAAARELAADIERYAAQARSTHDDLLKVFVELDVAALKVCGLLDEIKAGHAKIRAANQFLVQHGHSDLKCPLPAYTLAAHVGASSPMGIPRFEEWQLHGYRGWSQGVEVHPPLPAKRQLGAARELIK